VTEAETLQPTRLLVVRHGESNVTVNRQIGGPLTCTGLSDLGRQQAERLRDRVAAGELSTIDEVWASTMPRARETAEIINQAIGHELQLDQEFEEFRPGDADGMTFADYVEQYGMIDQMAEPYKDLSPGGESRSTFFLRVGRAFDDLVRSRPGKTLMVVCHGGVIDVVFRRLLNLHSEAAFQLWTTNTSVSEFITTSHGPPRQWRLGRYNDASHLYGLPSATNAH
jgi:probable phosphoglycerate mutase